MKREVPAFEFVLEGTRPSAFVMHRALTELEALMTNQEDSHEANEALQDLVLDALDEYLTEEEKWIVLATVYERMPLREIGRLLGHGKPSSSEHGKTHIARVRDRAFAKLRSALENEPLILERLKG